MHVLLNDEELMLAESVFSQAQRTGCHGTLRHYNTMTTENCGKVWQPAMSYRSVSLRSLVASGALTDAAIAAMALGRALTPVPYLGCAILPTQLLVAAGGA